MAENSFTKDPNATLDYTIDWADWLTDMSDTIATATWVPQTGSGITVANSTNTTLTATAWLSGGNVVPGGKEYRVRCRITTTGGRTDDRSIFLKVLDR